MYTKILILATILFILFGSTITLSRSDMSSSNICIELVRKNPCHCFYDPVWMICRCYCPVVPINK